MLALLFGCLSDFPDRHRDFDGDGVTADEDCDDEEPTVGVLLWYYDADGDGYGGVMTATECDQPDHTVSRQGDCDDATKTIFPGAEEACDGKDNDCDERIDDVSPGAPGSFLVWPDSDGDKFGDMRAPPTGTCVEGISDHTDCNDGNADVNPGETEVCGDGFDTDCDQGCGDCCFGDGEGGDNTISDAPFALYSSKGAQVGRALLSGDLFAESTPAAPVDSFAVGAPQTGGGTVWAVPRTAMGFGNIDVDDLRPDQEIAILRGATSGDLFGTALASIEGEAGIDLLVGAPRAEELVGSVVTQGAVYRLEGPLAVGSSVERIEVAFYAEDASWFGSDILTGFDFKGDGTADDVLVSAVNEAFDGEPFTRGAVYLFYGPTSQDSIADRISGTDDWGGFGTSIAAGDLDGSGGEDLLVGKAGPDAVDPEIGVFFGRADLGSIDDDDADFSFASLPNGMNLGSAIALGDFDGDGHTDVAAGASVPGEFGSGNAMVHVYLNDGTFTTVRTADVSLDEDDLTFVGTPTDRSGHRAGRRGLRPRRG